MIFKDTQVHPFYFRGTKIQILSDSTESVLVQGIADHYGGGVTPIAHCTPCATAKTCKKGTFSWLGGICMYNFKGIKKHEKSEKR